MAVLGRYPHSYPIKGLSFMSFQNKSLDSIESIQDEHCRKTLLLTPFFLEIIGWFQTLFLQILKSLNPKISTKVSDSPSKII